MNRWRQNLQSSGSGWGPGEQQLAKRVCRCGKSVDAGQCPRAMPLALLNGCLLSKRRPVTTQGKQGELTLSSRFLRTLVLPTSGRQGCRAHTHIALFVNWSDNKLVPASRVHTEFTLVLELTRSSGFFGNHLCPDRRVRSHVLRKVPRVHTVFTFFW